MNTKVIESRHVLELLITGIIALAFVRIYNTSPVVVAVGTIGITLAILSFFKKPEYTVLLLAVILPFRDIHLISIIHLKRFVLWSLLIYILIRQFTAPRKLLSPNLSLFTKVAALFVVALGISLMQTVSEFYTSVYLTTAVLKTIIFSNALVILEQILLVYIVYYLVETPRHIQRLIDVILVTSAIIALLGIIEYSLGGAPNSLRFLFDPEIRFYGRASSVFSNPNGFGIFLAPIIGIAFISLIWGERSKKIRLCFILPILILDSLAMFVSFSRTAIVQILFSMMVIGYLYYVKICHKKLSWKVLLIAIINVGLIFAAIQFYETFAQLRAGVDPMRVSSFALDRIKATSDTARKLAAITTIQTFLHHPIIGIGYEVISGKRIESVQWVENQYLKILAEMGLLGFIPFLILNGLIIRTGMKIWDKHRKNQVTHEIQIMMFLLLTAVSTHTFGYFFATHLNIMPVTGNFWVLSGAIFALERQCNG
jgi:putative inorganic carbon (HCO3(-)) transporter